MNTPSHAPTPLRLTIARATAWALLLAGWVGLGGVALTLTPSPLGAHALVALWLLALGIAATVATRDSLRARWRRLGLGLCAALTAAALAWSTRDGGLPALVVALCGWAGLTALASGVVRSVRLAQSARPGPPIVAASLGAMCAAIVLADPGDAHALTLRLGALVVIVLVVVAAAVGAYRLGWLSGIGRTSAKTDATPSANGSTASPNAPVAAENSPGVAATPAMERGNERPAVEGKAPSLGTEGREQHASEVELPVSVAETKKTESHASALANVGKKNNVVKAAPADSRATIAPQDDVYVPPKLVKAIRSLSPPEALRAYVSGVVSLDTVVDETGRVQSATPMSGPKPLYKKAEETVKDYVYQPATRNGKPVPAHVEVKIQFWYEP